MFIYYNIIIIIIADYLQEQTRMLQYISLLGLQEVIF